MAGRHRLVRLLRVGRTIHAALCGTARHCKKAVFACRGADRTILFWRCLGGQIRCFGLQLLRFSTAERLRAITAEIEAHGCACFDPHTTSLEDGGMKQVDLVQLAFKIEADPQGLLNPGKMRAWDERAQLL